MKQILLVKKRPTGPRWYTIKFISTSHGLETGDFNSETRSTRVILPAKKVSCSASNLASSVKYLKF
jgi:hypothetical protein